MAKKQKSIKKQAKTNKVKFGLRKLDFKKKWKKLSYLGLAGFLVVTSIGYWGWKSFDDSASAQSWTNFYNSNGTITLRVCGNKVSASRYKITYQNFTRNFGEAIYISGGNQIGWIPGTGSGQVYVNTSTSLASLRIKSKQIPVC